jgi:hypothetical protein
MNERIKELAEQCGFRSNPDIYDRNQSFNIQQFAELIVKECAEIANDHNSEVEGVTLGVGRALKQHFGVEE